MSQALTMTVTPSTLAIVVTGRAVYTDTHTLTVSTDGGWTEGHVYTLTLKAPGARGGAALVSVSDFTYAAGDLTYASLNLDVAGIGRVLRETEDQELLLGFRDETDDVTTATVTLTVYNPVQRNGDTPAAGDSNVVTVDEATALSYARGYWVVLCDTTDGAFTLTLPAVAGSLIVRVVNVGTNRLTIAPDGTETVNGQTGNVTIGDQYGGMLFVPTTGGWIVPETIIP